MMKLSKVLFWLLSLVLVLTLGAYTDTPGASIKTVDIPLFNVKVSGPYNGGIHVQGEFRVNWDSGFTVDAPENYIKVWCEFKDAEGKWTGEEVLWEEKRPLPIHKDRIWTFAKSLRPPPTSTEVLVQAELVLRYPEPYGVNKFWVSSKWYDLSKTTPTEENQNPTVNEPVYTPTKVTTATKVALTAQGSDPDDDELDYSWYVDGGLVAGPTPKLNGIELSGFGPGEHTVRVKVDDGKGGTAQAEVKMSVKRETNEPPTVTLSITRYTPPPPATVGQTFVATADDPDGDAKDLKYEWFTGPWGGAFSKQAETGHVLTWPSIPVGERWVVKVRVTDPDGASAKAIVEFDQKP